MDDLFANETVLPATPEGNGSTAINAAPMQHEPMILRDSRSYEDPVLLEDQRVLANILNRQADLSPPKENYFQTMQSEIKPHMRKIVTDWMLEVCEEQRCQPEVFSLAVNYLDRILSRVAIRKTQFQLLACVCLFLASKFKETVPLPAENLCVYTDNSVTTYEITQWELLILELLGWDLSAVTPYSILDHLLRSLRSCNDSSEVSPDALRMHSETFVALAATEHVFVGVSPAVVAVSCLGAALRGLRKKSSEPTTSEQDVLGKMELLTGVQKDCIHSCMAQIETSISLSMSGVSFQPPTSNSINNNKVNADDNELTVTTKIIPQQPGSLCQQSTTPTDIMDVGASYDAYVC